MTKNTLIVGTLLGLIMPLVGVFLGLQVSTTLGSIFAAPLIAVTLLTDVPFGMLSAPFVFLGLALSALIWIGICHVVGRFLRP